MKILFSSCNFQLQGFCLQTVSIKLSIGYEVVLNGIKLYKLIITNLIKRVKALNPDQLILC